MHRNFLGSKAQKHHLFVLVTSPRTGPCLAKVSHSFRILQDGQPGYGGGSAGVPIGCPSGRAVERKRAGRLKKQS